MTKTKLESYMRARNKLIVALLLPFLWLVACAPKVVGIYNPNQLKTKPKTFYVYGIEELKSLPEEEQKLNAQLVEIISSDLTRKGLKQSALADIYVSFIINVHSSQESREQPMNYWDYRYNNNYLFSPNISTRNYKEGVFIIDIKNQDNKLVWQGNKTFKLSSRESVREILPELCTEVINSFDLAKL